MVSDALCLISRLSSVVDVQIGKFSAMNMHPNAVPIYEIISIIVSNSAIISIILMKRP